MIKANFHTHSTLCDGRDEPEDIASFAALQGFTHLGFSGHMDPDIHMDLPVYLERIRKLQKVWRGKMDILLGIELDNLYDPSIGKQAEYIIGSTHFLDVDSEIPMSVDNTPDMLLMLCREFYGGDPYAMCRAYYELEAQVCDRLSCTFIGHFDLITRFNDELHFVDETDRRYTAPALEAMEYLVSRGVPFEINCGAVNLGRKKELYPRQSLLNSLRQMGGEILISSDAHRRELLHAGFDRAVQSALQAGFTHFNILEHDESGRIRWRQLPLDLTEI